MSALSSTDRARLFELWAQLETYSPAHAVKGIHHFARQVGAWIDASPQGVVLTRRQRAERADRHPASKAASGSWQWRHAHLDPLGIDAQKRRSLAAELARRPDLYFADPAFAAVTRRAGAIRVICPPKLAGRSGAEPKPGIRKLRSSDLGHRLIGSRPVDEGLELSVIFDRSRRARPFGTAELNRVQWALGGVGRLGRWYAMYLGHLGARRHLTPRERQTLQLLLAGLSEKELAMKLGLQRRSAHEHVLSLYRKFGVNSRPALMSLWTWGALPPTLSI